MAVTLITQAEYARRRGVDPTSVRDAIKAGRITLIDGKIDPDVADVQWARNSRARVRTGQEPPVRNPTHPQTHGLPAGDDDPITAPRLLTYEEARRRRELAEAQKAELQLAELQGDLIRTADVRAAYAKRAAGLREALLQIPARLAAVVAAEGDQAKCHDILQAELHQVLAQITTEEA
jgi:hypothetical protein